MGLVPAFVRRLRGRQRKPRRTSGAGALAPSRGVQQPGLAGALEAAVEGASARTVGRGGRGASTAPAPKETNPGSGARSLP